jgi:hypothetical protein
MIRYCMLYVCIFNVVGEKEKSSILPKGLAHWYVLEQGGGDSNHQEKQKDAAAS